MRSGLRWTPDEDRVIRWAIRRRIARKVIARELGRSLEALRERERRLGLHVHREGYRDRFMWNAGIMEAA